MEKGEEEEKEEERIGARYDDLADSGYKVGGRGGAH
jgi:hypothetical protein